MPSPKSSKLHQREWRGSFEGLGESMTVDGMAGASELQVLATFGAITH